MSEDRNTQDRDIDKESPRQGSDNENRAIHRSRDDDKDGKRDFWGMSPFGSDPDKDGGHGPQRPNWRVILLYVLLGAAIAAIIWNVATPFSAPMANCSGFHKHLQNHLI